MAKLATQPLVMPEATTSLSLTQNLDSLTAVNGTATGQLQVFDSLGKSHEATVTYTKEAAANTWSYSISMADPLTPSTTVAGQLSYSFGAGETVDPGSNLTITGPAIAGGTATTALPVFTGTPETVADYATNVNTALAAAGIVVGAGGVTVTGKGGVLTIAGATSTSGSVIADPVASANTAGTLVFNANGTLASPAANVSGMTFAGLSDGAATLHLDWGLYAANGTGNISQTAAASVQSAQSQNGSAGGGKDQTPTDFYSNFVSTLGATVSGVETENTAQNASVTQLQTQNNALSQVNLNDEASAMTTIERSYQAASQVFTMLNTIMASALNLGAQATVS
jgi:flagellar hook-associated protein FlgK